LIEIRHKTQTFIFICFPFFYPPINPGLNDDLLKMIGNYTGKARIVKFYETLWILSRGKIAFKEKERSGLPGIKYDGG